MVVDGIASEWCLALASGAVSHGDGAMSLRSNCARLSLDAVQVRAPATIDSLPQSDVGRGQHDSIDSDI